MLELEFGKDPANISERDWIIKMELWIYIKNEGNFKNLSPAEKVMLLKAQCTSVDVERSFSMLKKLSKSDRRFKPSNINNYMICYYNKKV